MDGNADFDVLVLGGGPAGICAALRLLDLGHQVALIEQQEFPRTQIGESLSPGIRNIFNYLKASELLTGEQYFPGLPASVIWENSSVQTISPEQRGPGLMVNRGQLDNALLQLAVGRGLCSYQPANIISYDRVDDFWQVQFVKNGQQKSIRTTFLLDARGRKGALVKNKIMTAPASVAIWTEVNSGDFLKETLIEATSHGWLWGAPVSANRFRVMLFADESTLRQQRPGEVLNSFIHDSKLFKNAVSGSAASDIQTCRVDSYCHDVPWKDNYIRLGEAAFTLDPLSSTGVEKAMRVSLQAAIAINTILRGGETTMSRTFYEDKLIESVVTHREWTADYYRQAWPSKALPFWEARSKQVITPTKNETQFQERLIQQVKAMPRAVRAIPPENIDVKQVLGELWYLPAKICTGTTFMKATCIVNDRLEAKIAIFHPNLDREIAYIGEIELGPLFHRLTTEDTFGSLLYKWGAIVPLEQAARIVVQLNRLGILIN